ncbi:MAG TPA: acyltransferase family protein, partial [Candidatus Acidoferrum sp.]|nr:acyltransferase family protein [Candidatus Acidoferrum sp.]
MHRDDIDGLRTLAVLPVIAFHFVILPKLFGGGFVGVDIFFVISGYLITRTIFQDVTNKTYSIVDFYNRRIRRIFPALFTVFAFCIIVAFFSSFPSEAAKIRESILSSICFVSNYLFYSQSGYFDRNSETNPLLHMWSLSVEEQFYVIFPIIIYLIRDFSNKARILLLCAATLASLLYSIWMVFIDPAAAFFLVQFRAWELLIGSLLAINAIPNLVRQWQAELVGAGGIALIVISVVLISANTPFPGLAALAPCVGAAAVIHAGAATKTLAGRILAFFPIRFVGLISYSLYLWHWPLIVFYRLFVNQPSRLEKGALLVICTIAATVSWKFIEKPFREKPYKLKAFGTLAAGGAVMIFTAVTSVALPSLIGSVFNYPSRTIEVLSYAKIDESHMRAGTCFLLSSNDKNYNIKTIVNNNCLAIRPKDPNYLIIGDSHAAHLWSGLQTSYPAVNFLQATVAGCTPILGEKGGSPACAEMMQYIFERFLPLVHLDGIIISAQWNSGEILSRLIKTANTARSYADRVIIFGPIVEYDQALPRIIARAIASHESETKFAELHRLSLPGKIDSTFSVTLENGPIQYVSVYRALCAQDCEIWATKKVPLQFDGNHLTCEGSIELARRVGPQLFPNIPPVNARDDACEAAVDGRGWIAT